ncbi:LAETG motif-containing sortase-dependent surface protein [Streptomyces sp. NPDC098781]|uniref:LAETG motif-containing sortase-dependent surface protein n=1 Tax=Streptomyces sp. NPDC098781 TaxID=3366097 RepID=UPI0037FA1C85
MRHRQALLTAAVLLPTALLTGATAHAAESPTPSVFPSPSAASNDPWDCYSDQEDPSMRPTLDGLPGRIAVGSGWHDLTLKVLNDTDKALEDVEVGLTKVAYDKMPDMPTESPEYVDMQRQDPTSRAWVDIPFPDDFEGVLTTTDVAPHETLTFRLRLRVNEGIPLGNSGLPKDEGKGEGDVMARLRWLDANDECRWSRAWEGFGIYESDPGQEDGPSSTAPSSPGTGTGAGTAPSGDLAETGSSSALPLLTLAGGAAVAVGGGAVYAVRRRRPAGGRN